MIKYARSSWSSWLSGLNLGLAREWGFYTDMKDIRIFIASSRELVRERNALAFLVLAHEEAFAARGLRVRLAKWEYVDPKMTEARTEDRYLDEMYDCDAAFVLFRDIAGMYTRE